MAVGIQIIERMLIIIQIYELIEGNAEEVLNRFYEKLQEVLNKEKESKRSVIIVGDWKCRIVREKCGEEILNSNRKSMLNFYISNHLLIVNTYW